MARPAQDINQPPVAPPVRDESADDHAGQAHDRVWTVPNVISALRIVSVPVIALLIAMRQPAWAFGLMALSGCSDWVDGFIARRFDQTSRLGVLLDPIADRLLILCTLVAMAVVGTLPWWLLAAIAARDVTLGVMNLVLAQHGYGPLPVHFLGKTGTAMLMMAIPVLVFASVSASPFFHILHLIAFAGSIWGLGLYWLAGLTYLSQAMGLLRSDGQPAGGADHHADQPGAQHER